MAHYRRVKKVLARANKIRFEKLEEIRKNMKEIEKVKMSFYPDHYDPSRNANGGSYISYEKFFSIGDDLWEKHYGNSSDFSYCPVHGQFQECHSCAYWWSDECRGVYGVISTKELVEYIYDQLKYYEERKEENAGWCGVEYLK